MHPARSYLGHSPSTVGAALETHDERRNFSNFGPQPAATYWGFDRKWSKLSKIPSTGCILPDPISGTAHLQLGLPSKRMTKGEIFSNFGPQPAATYWGFDRKWSKFSKIPSTGCILPGPISGTTHLQLGLPSKRMTKGEILAILDPNPLPPIEGLIGNGQNSRNSRPRDASCQVLSPAQPIYSWDCPRNA